MTEADRLLEKVYEQLDLANEPSPAKRYERIAEIVSKLKQINDRRPKNQKIAAATTGTISERLCKIGLLAFVQMAFGDKHENLLRDFGRQWEWVGDFLIPGHPFDVTVSVKSFKARERLLASGSGSFLAPTIGWGLFNDASEWTANRVPSYIYRGFVAIYLPAEFLTALTNESKAIRNLNGRPLLRPLHEFPADLTNAANRKILRIDFRKI
jgi:hypothetical protein